VNDPVVASVLYTWARPLKYIV